jgi:dTDP-4-amino-4,6-dideoxygalactose transaminase
MLRPARIAADRARVDQAIPFIDLQAQRRRLGEPLTRAITEAVESGQWVLGPQVERLEVQLASFAGVKHAVTCANGTDALLLVLRAWGVGLGDAVFVPAFTFAATAEVVVLAGAVPVFVDVLEDTFNMDPESLAVAIQATRRAGRLTPRAVIPVDLFGQPADYGRLLPLCEAEGLLVLCDTAQGFGAELNNRRTGAIGNAATTSFFPSKPLGCYGDGGACFTDDDALAQTLRSLRMHGQGSHRYEHVAIGLNSRLDTIQAAVLAQKLRIFPEEIDAREKIAHRYNAGLAQDKRIRLPAVQPGARSVWAQYTIRVEDRGRLQAGLTEQGIPTAIHYPAPVANQPAYAQYPRAPIPVSESLARSVLSLPMHPYLDKPVQDRIIEAVLRLA